MYLLSSMGIRLGLWLQRFLNFRWRHCPSPGDIACGRRGSHCKDQQGEIVEGRGTDDLKRLAVLRFQEHCRSRCVSPGPHCLCAKATSPWCLDSRVSRFWEFELLYTGLVASCSSKVSTMKPN